METERRLYILNIAVDREPEAPANYLLRGEYWLEQGKMEQARQDLTTAKTLAEAQREAQDWGYAYQSYADRAAELLNWL